MVALALGLLGLACSDLAAGLARAVSARGQEYRSVAQRRVRGLQALAGLVVVVLAAWATGLFTDDRGVALTVVAVAGVVVLGWQATGGLGEQRPWAPLAVLGLGLAGLLLLGGLGGDASTGALAAWMHWVDLPGIDGVAPDRLVLLVALVLAQLSTGNVVVRLVLRAVDISPPESDDRDGLQGGRVLGPMERLLILGLGLAGEVTAASIVIAAKGLIRWPELSRARSQSSSDGPFAPDQPAPSIHEQTEYFLVGSFVSWLVALGSLVLAALG